MRSFKPSIVSLQITALICTMIIVSTVSTEAQQADHSILNTLGAISTERMLADVRTLSGPFFNGREAGTDDDLRSAQWLSQELTLAGLQLPLIYNGSLTYPLPGTGKSPPVGILASIISTSVIGPNPVFRTGTVDHFVIAQLSTDYLPIFDSPTADIQGPLVFVGYGIVDPAQGIDDYAGVDVNNSIVFFLRGKPDHYPHPVSHADKVRFARNHGALAYLTATGPILHPYEARHGVTGEPSAFYGQLPLDQAIPGAWINTLLAESLLAEHSEGSTADGLRNLQAQLNKTPLARSIRTNRYVSLHWKTTTQDGVLTNVVGVLPGTGPDTIVIGAHRDHFGRPAGLLFPGADDNASGTAVMLEVARALVKTGVQPQRTILFVSFSGEEKDLLGSRLYTSRPIVPLSSTKAMINIDHAGVGNGRLTVGVTGLDKSVALEAGQTAGFTEKLDVFGFFPGSDHVPFKEAGVPTITVVSSGVHPHFHQSTDTADTINPVILQSIARYVLALTWQLANTP